MLAISAGLDERALQERPRQTVEPHGIDRLWREQVGFEAARLFGRRLRLHDGAAPLRLVDRRVDEQVGHHASVARRDQAQVGEPAFRDRARRVRRGRRDGSP